MNKVLAVIKYEYFRTVRRPAFWLTTLLIPLMFVVVLAIQLYSAQQSKELFTKLSGEIKSIQVIDETGLIKSDLLVAPLSLATSTLESAITQVKSKQIDAVIYFPKTLVTDGKYQIYAQQKGGLLGGAGFSSVGESLLKQSLYKNISNPNVAKLLQIPVKDNSTFFDAKGQEVKIDVKDFILPIVSLVIFFMSVFIAAQYLLQSVSEEKENRMIETILSLISSRVLITGKILGLSGVVLTQMCIWLLASLIVLLAAHGPLSSVITIDLTGISLAALPFNLYMTLMGFLMFAAIMVGVGAISTSYRDSQSLSAVFIILSIVPVYIIPVLLAEPNGSFAMFFSYFPLTAPMILLARNSLGILSPAESILALVITLIYVIIAFWVAIKMFDLGSLMYNRRPSLKEVWSVLRR